MNARRIRYRASFTNVDQELDKLRDRIARAIAQRLAAMFAASEPVPWTAKTRFLPEGIEHRPAGFFRRKPPTVIPYTEITAHEFKDGVFHAWVRGQKKSVINMPVSAFNFFPGYFLFLMIRHGAAAGQGS
jgi:hypothetical protein